VKPPRLVATDLDGTIVRDDGTISARTVAALRAVEDAGADLVIVTGRPPRWLGPIAERLGHEGVAICANGALVYDLATERVVARYSLEAATVAALVAALRAELPDARFAVEYDGRMAYEPGFRLVWEHGNPLVSEVAAEELERRPAAKLLLREETFHADALLERARTIVGDLAELTHSSSSGLLEISATGVSKASTLAHLCAERGIDASEVVAFGDMPNDLALLAWAGRAYAVANAHPDVLAAVTDHTAGVEDDGVAQVLERWFR
jgi:Cof subfamily protein (haloacid dehalogenase superfamily)